MALGTSANTANIKRRLSSGYGVYVKETDSAGTPLTTGDGTVWTSLGYIKSVKLDPQLDEFKDKDASGTVVVDEVDIEQYVLGLTIMQNDSTTMKIGKNADGKYYQIAVDGPTHGTQTTAHALFGKIRPGFSMDFEDGYLQNVQIVTIAHAASLSVTLPTQIASSATITIPINEMWEPAEV